jgi:transmembrane sensor
MQSEDRFIQLLSRKMAGEASIQELVELDKLGQQNPLWNNLINRLSVNPVEITEADTDNADAAFAAHALKMHLANLDSEMPEIPLPVAEINKTKRIFFRPLLRIAAILIVAVGGFYIFQTFNRGAVSSATNEIVTKKGSSSKIKLPDGTQVWLNSDSKLSYAENFTGNLREVKLTGEAFFDVTHDSARPFIIHTDKINIKVLGTAFNVKSYPQDETEETTLIRGKIEVTFNGRPSEKLILKPKDKLIVRNNQAELLNTNSAIPKMELKSLSMVKDSIVAETAWLNNTLTFANQDLQAIAHMLERRFDVRIDFKDDEVKQFPYTGTYETESLEKILEFLQLSKPFHFIIKDKIVTITK